MLSKREQGAGRAGPRHRRGMQNCSSPLAKTRKFITDDDDDDDDD